MSYSEYSVYQYTYYDKSLVNYYCYYLSYICFYIVTIKSVISQVKDQGLGKFQIYDRIDRIDKILNAIDQQTFSSIYFTIDSAIIIITET